MITGFMQGQERAVEEMVAYATSACVSVTSKYFEPTSEMFTQGLVASWVGYWKAYRLYIENETHRDETHRFLPYAVWFMREELKRLK